MSSLPLAGRRVLVTRNAPAVVERLSALGATVIEAPAIAIEPPDDPRPLDDAIDGIDGFAWVVFTSANAVHSVADRLRGRGRTLPSTVQIASVGRATTAAVAESFAGRRADLEPRDFSADALVEAFSRVALDGARLFLPVSDRAADTVSTGLEARGALVRRVIAYRTVPSAATAGIRSILAGGIDVVAFASPSAVEAYATAVGERAASIPAAVIGPTTAAAARKSGLDVVAQASPSTLEGLAEAIALWLTPKR